MKKIIKLGFIDKKLERRAPFPLVVSDKNSYLLEMDVSKYPDAKKVFIYAKRADGEVVCDSVDTQNGSASYILKQNIYCVPGELSIRLVLRGEEDTILTAAEMLFEVFEGNFEGISAEEMNTVETCIIKLSEIGDGLSLKSDKEYVDAEFSAIKTELINKSDKDYVEGVKKDVYNLISETTNSLKRTQKGESVVIDDVSLNRHTVKVKVESKNLYDMSKAVFADKNVTYNGDGTITVPPYLYFVMVNTKVGVLCPDLKAGDTIVISSTSPTKNVYVHGMGNQLVRCGTPITVTDEILNSTMALYGINTTSPDYGQELTFAIQVERGEAVTDWTPYVDPKTATLTVYGTDETDRNQTFEPTDDCTYEIPSVSPTMTFLTDTPNTLIEVEYNQDINAYKKDMQNIITQLKQAIIELGGTV